MDETDIRALVAESVSKVRKEMEVLKHEVTELKGETVELKNKMWSFARWSETLRQQWMKPSSTQGSLV